MSSMRASRSVLASVIILLMFTALVSLTTIGASAAALVRAPSQTKALAVSESRIEVSWQDNSAWVFITRGFQTAELLTIGFDPSWRR